MEILVFVTSLAIILVAPFVLRDTSKNYIEWMLDITSHSGIMNKVYVAMALTLNAFQILLIFGMS